MGNRQVHLKKFTKTFSSVTESVSHSLSLSLLHGCTTFFFVGQEEELARAVRM